MSPSLAAAASEPLLVDRGILVAVVGAAATDPLLVDRDSVAVGLAVDVGATGGRLAARAAVDAVSRVSVDVRGCTGAGTAAAAALRDAVVSAMYDGNGRGSAGFGASADAVRRTGGFDSPRRAGGGFASFVADSMVRGTIAGRAEGGWAAALAPGGAPRTGPRSITKRKFERIATVYRAVTGLLGGEASGGRLLKGSGLYVGHKTASCAHWAVSLLIKEKGGNNR